MLAIRMQRTGRKGHAQFRVVVQDSRFSPTSGRVVAYLGSYNPHTKTTTLDKEKAASYLTNGAQPTERVAGLFKSEGVKLPVWVKQQSKHERVIRNPEKLRRNRPAEVAGETPTEAEAVAEAPTEEQAQAAAAPNETPAEDGAEKPADEAAPAEDKPAS